MDTDSLFTTLQKILCMPIIQFIYQSVFGMYQIINLAIRPEPDSGRIADEICYLARTGTRQCDDVVCTFYYKLCVLQCN